MPARVPVANGLNTAVAIRDVQLVRNQSFAVETFELCTLCGAHFGIGYPNGTEEHHDFGEGDDLSKKLTEILAKDHRQNREHKPFIELDL
jgi:hypothetical protein